jgi:hypothetical protein
VELAVELTVELCPGTSTTIVSPGFL